MSVAEPAVRAPVAPKPIPHLGRRRRGWWLPWLALILVIAGVGGWALLRPKAPAPSRYITGAITVGDLAQSVETTGTVQPIVQVQVSSQVSGRVLRVLVDFNTRVHQGELIAELDAAPFRAQLEQSRGALISAQGNLARAEADLAAQEINLRRANQLLAQHLNAQIDVDSARGARDVSRGTRDASRGAVIQARAALTSAQNNLNFTQIRAPIEGMVITRSVDPGATVAASLSAPTLFVIANDMHRMQVLADIQEAYVGRLHDGLGAEVRVDAFRGEVFRGSVREVRFAPTTVSGVVTYPAVIEVDNPDGKLRPGMTATVTIGTAQREHVLRVPNAALRFRPSTGTPRTGGSGAGGGAGGGGGGRGGRTGSADPSSGRVFVLENGAPRAVRVRVGISDGAFTEVTGQGLSEGTQVVLEETDPATPRTPAASGATRSPLSGTPSGAGGGGGRRGP